MPSKLTVRLWLTTCVLLYATTVSAQQKTVTGKVTGGIDRQPIFGATVAVKASNVATVTDKDGNYSLIVPSDKSILVVTFVGFEALEVPVSGQAQVDIVLIEKTSTLTDVIVTGYTSQARKDITGSISVVKTEELKSTPAGNAEVQIQGRAPGVTVITSNQPGDGASVRIRGFTSISASNAPLFVIDGVPAGGLASIASEEIESMQILKDASAASIYGARASGGVIIITTKKGKPGPVKVSYDFYYGTQNPGKGFDLLNSQEYADLVWLAYKNSGSTPPSALYGTGATPVLPDYILPAGKMEGDPAVDPAKYKLNYDDIPNSYLITRANKQGTNWYDELTRNAPITRHNLAVSGANDKTRYMVSLNYFDQEGIVIENFAKRYSLRVNTEFNIRNKLRIGENLQLLYQQDNRIVNNDEGAEISQSYRNQPIIPVYDIMGNFAGSRGGIGNSDNPVAIRRRANKNRSNHYYIFGNVYAELDLFRHLTARSSFGGIVYINNYYFHDFPSYENQENTVLNAFTEGNIVFHSWTWTNTLNYSNLFGKHRISALIGTESILEGGRTSEAQRQAFFSNSLGFRTLSSGSGQQVVSGAPMNERALYSLFGKVDYVYNDKYLAGVIVRRDGSSAFGPENRYGVFPAFSLGWRLSEEGFMQSIDWIRDFKLRGGWGQMGNQSITAANQFTQFSPRSGTSFYDIGGTGNTLTQGFYLSFIGNKAGKWETNTTTNIGFDATLFRGKTEIIFDVYRNRTTDLLFNAEQLGNSGTTAANNPPAFNVGAMRTWGIDLGITQKVVAGDFKLGGTFTFTTYKNKITNIATGIDFFDVNVLDEQNRIGGPFVRNAVGRPLSSFYGYKVIGLFQSADEISKSPGQPDAKPGRFKYLDANNDDTITQDDKVWFGDPNPDFTYGLNLDVTWKNWDLLLFFYGSAGRDAINYVKWWTDLYPSFAGGKSKDALYKSWLPDRTNTNVPIAENAASFSSTGQINSFYLENASYLRCKNLTLGYTIPKKTLDRWKIDKLRFFVQATNLFTITKYTGLDPEIIGTDQSFGVDVGIYPTVRTYLVGLNVSF
jgi:TonB-linked SusC/RagA family outer membrane protein